MSPDDDSFRSRRMPATLARMARAVFSGGRHAVRDVEPDFWRNLRAELLAGRGEDPRLYERTRSTSRERRAAYLESMDGKERARQELRDEAAQGLWTDPGETD